MPLAGDKLSTTSGTIRMDRSIRHLRRPAKTFSFFFARPVRTRQYSTMSVAVGVLVGIVSTLLATFGLSLTARARQRVQVVWVRPPGSHLTPGRRRAALSYPEVGAGLCHLVQKLKDSGEEPDLIAGINRGGAILGGLIAKQLGISAEKRGSYPLALLYVDRDRGGGTAEVVFNPLAGHPAPRSVLLVDDAIHDGRHVKLAYDAIRNEFDAENIRCAVLLRHVGAKPGMAVVYAYGYRGDRREIVLPWDR